MKERLEITSHEAAQVLTNPSEMTVFEYFMADAKHLSEVAKQLGMKLNTLHYRVEKLMRLGLLNVVREEARNGRATKFYQASAKSYLVPFDLLSEGKLEFLHGKWIDDAYQTFQKNWLSTVQEANALGKGLVLTGSSKGVHYTTDFSELKQRRDLLEIGEPAVLLSVGQVRLKYESAKAFQNDLARLIEKYRAPEQKGEQAYTYLLGISPLQDIEVL